MRFWTRSLHLFGGRLAIVLVRNDDLGRGLRARCERIDDGPFFAGGVFCTAQVGTFWLNVDWLA